MEKIYLDIMDILTYGTEIVMDGHIATCERAADSLRYLIEGHEHFLNEEDHPMNLIARQREATAINGQNPLAVVVCCADSRVPPEYIFDAGLGEIFVIRNAGNLTDNFTQGSIEYAVEHLDVPLVVVMGHTHCGAVDAALSGERAVGSLGCIIAEVGEAIGDCRNSREAELLNLKHSMHRLGESRLLHQMHNEGRVEFAAALYDIETGKVEYLR